MQSLETRLLEFVTPQPQTATEIWRRFADQPRHKVLTTRLRKQRRETAALLEDLAEDGKISRGSHEEHPTTPVYWRGDAYDAAYPSRAVLERRHRDWR